MIDHFDHVFGHFGRQLWSLDIFRDPPRAPTVWGHWCSGREAEVRCSCTLDNTPFKCRHRILSCLAESQLIAPAEGSETPQIVQVRPRGDLLSR